MRKLVLSTLVLVIGTAAFAVSQEKINQCLSPEGTISDCNVALWKGPVEQMDFYNLVLRDKNMRNIYLAVEKKGCEKGISLLKSGAKFDSSETYNSRNNVNFFNASGMCMNYGSWIFDHYRDDGDIKADEIDDLAKKLDERIEYLKSACELYSGGCVNYDLSKNKKLSVLSDVSKRIKWQKTQDENKILENVCAVEERGDACVKLGLNMLLPPSNRPDWAIEWFKKGWLYGEGTAAYALAGYYINGLSGYPHDMKEALKLLDSGCGYGKDHRACVAAAKIYDLGDGVAADTKMAEQYYASACKLDGNDSESCSRVPLPVKKSKSAKGKK